MHADPKSITLTPAAEFTLQRSPQSSNLALLEVVVHRRRTDKVLILMGSNSLRCYEDIFRF